MNIFLPSHLDIISLFNDEGVKYLLIGGYAVIAHGYARTTGDLDLWIEPSNENKIIRLQDLILMKINTGRSKDASDIEELQKISNQNKK